MPTALRPPAPTYLLERTTLGNGLRVLLAPDRSAPVIGLSVHYDVGMRSEPEGRTGFAHLFEHLMFQGSASLDKLAHFRYVQSSGGTFNGTTHRDYTNYFELLPSNALERGLFLEADRMRAPTITAENLVNQISVVKEEIRVNVQNRPYGGFPWLMMPTVLYDTFPNAHDGYGSFEDLEAATLDDAWQFFERYYAPANAVLCVAGDIDLDQAALLVERHFADIPARQAPTRPDFAEPDLTAERWITATDRLAPMPAVAAGWRVPDPVHDLAGYLPFVVLAEVLSDGDASRLQQRLVRRDRAATEVHAYLSFLGDPFDVRDPTEFLVQATYPVAVTTETVLSAVDDELSGLAEGGLRPGELARVQARIAAQLLREVDGVLGRTLALASLEQQHDRAELLSELPGLISGVTAEQVAAAAATLTSGRRAVVELIAGGAR